MAPEGLAAYGDSSGYAARVLAPIAMGCARRYSRAAPWLLDEFESAALVGLARAVRTYDPDRGGSFRTHVICCVRQEFSLMMRLWRPRGYVRSARPAPAVVPLDERSVADPAAAAGAAGVESRDEFASLLRGLPPRHAEALLCHYGPPGLPLGPELARRLGVSKGTLSKLVAEAEAMVAAKLGVKPRVRSLRKYDNADRAVLHRLAAANPGASPARVAELFRAETGRWVDRGSARSILRGPVSLGPPGSERQVEWRGETMSVAGWSRRTGIPARTIAWRLTNGKTEDEALSKPGRGRRAKGGE